MLPTLPLHTAGPAWHASLPCVSSLCADSPDPVPCPCTHPLPRRRRRWLLVLRGVLGFCSGSALYMSVSLLPLADASVLSFLSPIFVAALRWVDGWVGGQRGRQRLHGMMWRCPAPAGLRLRPIASGSKASRLVHVQPSNGCPFFLWLPPVLPLCSPLILKEKSSTGTLLGIPVAMLGVVLVAKPTFLFGGDSAGIRWGPAAFRGQLWGHLCCCLHCSVNLSVGQCI
jgi:drug/metabolite transporter (DMT)-like permease